MLAIFKREFKNFFQNVIGWVFIASMIFISALYFRAYNIGYGLTDIVYVLVRLLMIMIFSIPVLTMRILTEDRKQKIDQLTLTAPISVGKIIIGKYLAMFSVMFITVAAICVFPVFLSKYASIDWGINLLGMLGFLLYGAACIAICMFVSSFTESQVIAAIISIITMFTIYLLSGIRSMFDASGSTALTYASKVLETIDLNKQFDMFLSGILDVRVIVYFIVITCVFLFLTCQSVQKRRYTTSIKNFSLGAFSFISIIVVFAIAIILNIGVKRIPDKYAQIDLTQNQLYSICDATVNVVNEVKEPITIYVYASEDDKDDVVDKLLKKYSGMSSLISVEYVDPNKSPKFYEKYTSNSISYNTLFVVSETRNKVVDYDTLYITDYSMNDDGSYETTTSYDIEGQITSAINFINNGSSAKVYNLTGHDEMELETTFLDSIAKQNYTCEDINLIGNEIPEDCEMLIINSPLSDIAAEDADKIISYAENGGKLLIVIPFADNTDFTNLNRILAYYNVKTDLGFVVDTQKYDSAPYILIPNMGSDTATTDLVGKKVALAPYCKAIYTIDSEDTTCDVNPWLYSTDSSYRKNTAIEEVTDYSYVEGVDEDGPCNLAVTVVKSTENSSSTAYITGSTYLFSETANSRTSNANLTIFMNIINNCVATDGSAVVVPVKSMEAERFVVSNIEGLAIFLILLIVVPLALLVSGFVIWMKRRKR